MLLEALTCFMLLLQCSDVGVTCQAKLLFSQICLREVDTELRPLLVSASLKPGVRRLVSHLARHRVPAAIATSSREANSRVKMSGHRELFALFSHKVFGSDDPEVRRGKPDPDIFLVAAGRFPDHPNPENCLVFEDSVSGVQGALRAGMQVRAYYVMMLLRIVYLRWSWSLSIKSIQEPQRSSSP